jgi:DNA polymerase-3 subunit gamma/tau
MTHTALARKYRPTRFGDLIGQRHVATGLAGAVAKNRVAHGYLLAGPRGTGKTTAARILAMALNCERRDSDSSDGEPCGECDSCRRVWAGSANLDVVEIDAASNRGVDDARELRERAMYAASGPDRYKVYIIDEAHMLTREAWNALLKILEEPPPRVVFVFATTDPQKIANTAGAVLSRLQRFDFRNLGPEAIVGRLKEVAAAEGITVEDDALALIARVARGGMRDALSMFDQIVVFGDGAVTTVGVHEALGLIDDDLYGELLSMLAERRTTDVFGYVARLVEQGADLAEFVAGTGEVLRALMLRILGGDSEGLTERLKEVIGRVAGEFSQGDVLRMLKLLQDSEATIRRSPNTRLHVETLLLHWTMLDRTVEIAQVLEAVRGGGTSTRAPAPAEEPAPALARRAPAPSRGQRGPSQPAPSSPEPEAPAAPPPPTPTPTGPATLESLQGAWHTVLDGNGRKNPILRETLSQARPSALVDGVVSIEVTGGEIQIEGLVRNKSIVQDALTAFFGTSTGVEFSAPPPERPEPSAEPRRKTQEADREDRLRSYRAQDPALDAVADALDLELLE